MKNLSAILALAILLTVGLACSDSGKTTSTDNAANKGDSTAAKNESAENGVSIAWVKLYKDDGSGGEGDEVTGFKASDNPQHFKAHLSEFESGTRIKAVFTAVNAGGENNFKILEKEIETNSITNEGVFSLKMPNPFPVGDYKADFYINGKLAKTVNYKVQ